MTSPLHPLQAETYCSSSNQNRYSIRKIIYVLLVALVLLASANAQTLTTDSLDYQPGSVATLSGSGFGAGETVIIQVSHASYPNDDSISFSHLPWDVTS